MKTWYKIGILIVTMVSTTVSFADESMTEGSIKLSYGDGKPVTSGLKKHRRDTRYSRSPRSMGKCVSRVTLWSPTPLGLCLAFLVFNLQDLQG